MIQITMQCRANCQLAVVCSFVRHFFIYYAANGTESLFSLVIFAVNSLQTLFSSFLFFHEQIGLKYYSLRIVKLREKSIYLPTAIYIYLGYWKLAKKWKAKYVLKNGKFQNKERRSMHSGIDFCQVTFSFSLFFPCLLWHYGLKLFLNEHSYCEAPLFS